MNDSHLGDEIFGEEPEKPSWRRRSGGDDRHRLPAERPPRSREAARRRRERTERAEAERVPPRLEEDRGGTSRRGRWLPIVLALALVVCGGGLAVKTLGLSVPTLSFGSGEQDYDGDGSGSVDVRVRPGDSGFDIGSRLADAGVVKSASTFAGVFGSDPDASKLRPGTYSMRKKMSSGSALSLMLDPKSRTGAGVTVPEGLWASEIYKRLSKATGEPVSAYQKVKPSALGLPAGAKGKVEGYLFPSTYEFAEGESATAQLRRMVTEFKKQTRSLNVPADQLHRVVTIASIVQAESRGGKDDPKVARVVLNRMKEGGETVGRLQMDSTVHYSVRKRGKITTTAQQRADKSPYNTYRVKGLPPGPIDNPGVAALKAAAEPAQGDWMYFVTVNPQTGETRFADDKKGHDANVKAFQAWCKKNPDGC